MTEKLFVDLHVHTHFSDGSYPPSEVVRYAQQVGLGTIAITDHDITDGIAAAITEGAKRGVEIIPGIELSAELQNNADGEMHILGYFINWEDRYLQQKLKIFRQARRQRANLILEKLKKLNIHLDEKHLLSQNDIGVIGRLHFAKQLISEKYVNNVAEAFHRYLGFGQPAYVPKIRLNPVEAIKMILRCGGIPVLAHPYYGDYSNKSLIRSLKKSGLAGIEVWHSKHPYVVSQRFHQLAREMNLLETGGSDCHGPIMNDEPLMGKIKIPYNIVAELKRYKFNLDRTNKNIL